MLTARRFGLFLRHVGELREAVARVYRLLDAEVQEAKRIRLDDPAGAVHEVRTDNDEVVTTFRGPVPRVGEYVWTDHGAWRVTEVAWWVRGRSSVARACVYVEPLRDGCGPNDR